MYNNQNTKHSTPHNNRNQRLHIYNSESTKIAVSTKFCHKLLFSSTIAQLKFCIEFPDNILQCSCVHRIEKDRIAL